ncbi:MAG: hypothetical protein H6711_21150 [Myxococcales bacterium]|nr:hypothetical protein [Myxococcales bacterium]
MAIYRELRRALKDPARAGDIPVYKSELSRTRARPEIEALLDDVRDYRPRLDLDALATLPEGTFGRAYVRFIRDNGLHPLVISDQVDPALVARNAFVVRYGIIHDMVHVLTGFDASWPGEIGVWAFVAAQGYSRVFTLSAILALLIAPLRAPTRLGASWRSFRRGWAMGREARRVLPLRLEERLGDDLAATRAELGIVV